MVLIETNNKPHRVCISLPFLLLRGVVVPQFIKLEVLQYVQRILFLELNQDNRVGVTKLRLKTHGLRSHKTINGKCMMFYKIIYQSQLSFDETQAP